MSDNQELFLHEEVFLLACNDEKGTVKLDGRWPLAVGAAILAELALRGRIAIDSDEEQRVTVVNGVPLGEPVLDESLAMIVAADEPQSARSWVRRFAELKRLKEQVAQRLVDRDILCEEVGRVLRFFAHTVYPEKDSRAECAVVQRLHEAIFTDTPDVTPRTAVLAAVARETGLLNEVFDRRRLKQRRQRIEALVSGQVAGTATGEAVAAAETAAALVVILAAVT